MPNVAQEGSLGWKETAVRSQSAPERALKERLGTWETLQSRNRGSGLQSEQGINNWNRRAAGSRKGP